MEVQVRFENDLNHPFFDYIDKDNREDIEDRIRRGVSQIVFFLVDGVKKFATVIDFHYGCIHVREVGGHFPFMWKYLREFCDGLAKFVGVSSITFKTYITGVKYLAKKAGFELNSAGEFERQVQ